MRLLVFAWLLSLASSLLAADRENSLAWPPAARPLASDGLVFLWENGSESNSVPTGGPVDELCRLIAQGSSKLNRYWAMDVEGGAFHAEQSMNTRLLTGWQASQQLTIEVTVTASHSDVAGVAEIVSFADPEGWSFMLSQEGESLRFGIRSSVSSPTFEENVFLELGTVVQGEPRHVVVTVGDDALTGYVDGRKVGSRKLRQMDFNAWEQPALTFGRVEGSPNAATGWVGSIEGVALYSRALRADEVTEHYQAYSQRIIGRTPLQVLEVRARLTTKRRIPKAEAYPNSLVVFDYRVSAVNKGVYEEKKILVTHWGNLNRHRQQATQNLRIGQSYRLKLEPFEDHPELAAIQLVMNEDDFHLPLFYAVADPVTE